MVLLGIDEDQREPVRFFEQALLSVKKAILSQRNTLKNVINNEVRPLAREKLKIRPEG